jgi:hypothetical protein
MQKEGSSIACLTDTIMPTENCVDGQGSLPYTVPDHKMYSQMSASQAKSVVRSSETGGTAGGRARSPAEVRLGFHTRNNFNIHCVF